MTRLPAPRALLAAAALAVGGAFLASCSPAPAAAAETLTVYKTPTCGCCASWAEHMRENGFRVVTRDTADLAPIKAAHAVPSELHSCHTALVGGYVVEGHVPAEVVRRLLAERAPVAGIGVPGMPMGSPGMEGPYSEPYEVIAFDRGGRTQLFERR